MAPTVSTVLVGIFSQPTAWDVLKDLAGLPRLSAEDKDRPLALSGPHSAVPSLAAEGGNHSYPIKKGWK